MKSHFAIATLAGSGAIETGYLTYSKVFANSQILCSSGESCQNVLSSPFSSIPNLNIPLVSIGCLVYLSIALLSANQAVANQAIAKQASIDLSLIILFLCTSAATFSFYLLMVLNFAIKSTCDYCYASAFISVSLALISWQAKIVQNATKAFIVSLSSISITAVLSGFLFYATINNPEAALASIQVPNQISSQITADSTKRLNSPPKIAKHSDQKSVALSEKLNSLNAKMYGAYWCSHCYNQKQILGIEAFKTIPYIECDKEGELSQYPICKEKKIPGYPTWEINGKLYPGEKEINELEKIVSEL